MTTFLSNNNKKKGHSGSFNQSCEALVHNADVCLRVLPSAITVSEGADIFPVEIRGIFSVESGLTLTNTVQKFTCTRLNTS